MNALEAIRQPIASELSRYDALFAASLSHTNPLLNFALQHLLQRKGKAMRPALVLLAARYAGRVTESVLHAAVALELLHTASLVHDDIVDESPRRRGQASVNALLDNKAAVLVGDYLLSEALWHAAQTGSLTAVGLVATLGKDLSDGELQQLANIDGDDLTAEAYFHVIEKKTASLFEACARLGALLAGGASEDVATMARFGLCVGLAFQLRDDIFDYDTANDTGKPTGNDMREGKLTLPLLHALATTGNGEMRTRALRVRAAEATQEDIDSLVAFAKEQGGMAHAESEMTRLGQEAVGVIATGRDEAVGEALRAYALFVAQRNR